MPSNASLLPDGRKNTGRNYVSSVDPRLTKHPFKNNKAICGAFKTNMALRFKTEHLTVEDILADQQLFKEMICTKVPLVNGGHQNGRCLIHGARQGRKISSGKYAKFISTFTPEQLKDLYGAKQHQNLDNELLLIAKSIEDKLEIINGGATTPIANKALFRLIEDAKRFYEAMDFIKMRACFDRIQEHCKETEGIKSAERDMERLVETYSKVFSANLKQRELNGEFISRENHLRDMQTVFTICAVYILNDNDRQEVKNQLQRLLIPDAGPSLYTTSSPEGEYVGLEDQNNGEDINSIQT